MRRLEPRSLERSLSTRFDSESVTDSELMRASHLLAATLLMQAGAASVRQPIERTLDLVTVARPLRESPEGCGCVGGIDHADAPKVAITLVQVSPEAFGVGDDLVLELLVDNVGRSRISIALTRDPDLAPSCHMTDTDVATTFALIAKGGSQIIGVSPRFSGSLAAVGTTMNLNAGQRLRVRLPATAVGIDQTRASFEDPQALDVEAMFNTQRRCAAAFGRSKNTRLVHVSRPQ